MFPVLIFSFRLSVEKIIKIFILFLKYFTFSLCGVINKNIFLQSLRNVIKLYIVY